VKDTISGSACGKRSKVNGSLDTTDMSRFTQPSQDDSGYVLVARMDNAKNLSTILKAVQFREVSVERVVSWNAHARATAVSC